MSGTSRLAGWAIGVTLLAIVGGVATIMVGALDRKAAPAPQAAPSGSPGATASAAPSDDPALSVPDSFATYRRIFGSSARAVMAEEVLEILEEPIDEELSFAGVYRSDGGRDTLLIAVAGHFSSPGVSLPAAIDQAAAITSLELDVAQRFDSAPPVIVYRCVTAAGTGGSATICGRMASDSALLAIFYDVPLLEAKSIMDGLVTQILP